MNEHSLTGRFHRSYPHSPGALPITIRVDDGPNIVVKKIIFYPFGQPPVAELECKELHAIADNVATGVAGDKYVTVCDASKSSDPDGSPLTYEISWGDSLVERSPDGKFIHSYLQGGEYDLTLRVNDGVSNTYKKLNWIASATTTTPPSPTTCEFHVTNEWSTGFTGWVRVKNNSENIVNGWGVNLAFSGSNRISNFWNASTSGDNPYTLANFSWNGDIDAGAYVEVGFNGVKNGGSLETPTLSGMSCGQ
ncbi:MAG: PKD domain-containing protein [Moraxellaceae bacterium]|nr:MAG: PKD domain-containing protein [Moraxellaceae bacterium]